MPAFLLSIFSGYPAWLIARWCGVEPATADSWKTGKRKPSRSALRLFALHRDEQVLGEPWRGWTIREGTIVDPDGNATTQAQLRAYWLIMQYAAELARRNPVDDAHFHDLLRRA